MNMSDKKIINAASIAAGFFKGMALNDFPEEIASHLEKLGHSFTDFVKWVSKTGNNASIDAMVVPQCKGYKLAFIPEGMDLSKVSADKAELEDLRKKVKRLAKVLA